MKVVLVHNRYVHEGGEEQAVALLEKMLRDNHHEVYRFERSSQEWAAHRPWQRIRDACQTIYSFESARQFSAVLRNFQPDLVHIHNVFPVLSPSIYWAAQRGGIPVVQTLHNYRFLCANGLFLTPQNKICERCKSGFFWNAARWGCYQNSRWKSLPMALSLTLHRQIRTFDRCIDRFIAPSQFLKSKLVEAGFPEDRIDVLANPAEIAIENGGSLASQPTFVYLGRLSREKGLWTLLRAFLPANVGQLRLIGDGPLAGEIQRYLQENRMSHVQLLGRCSRETVHHWLSQAWGLIMPSECYENLPQAILEAWSHGTPVIASRLGGLAEAINEGETGWLFAPGDSGDLQRTIRKLLDTPGEGGEFRVKCRNNAKKYYNLISIYQQLLTIYERVLHRNLN